MKTTHQRQLQAKPNGRDASDRPWRVHLVLALLAALSLVGSSIVYWTHSGAERARTAQGRKGAHPNDANQRPAGASKRVATERNPAPGPLTSEVADPSGPASSARGTDGWAASTTSAAAGLDSSLPWRHAGLCSGQTGTDVEERRARYLATFVPTEAWKTTVYVHPQVLARSATVIIENLWAVRNYLRGVHEAAVSRLGISANPPLIYLYPSVEALREHSCASANAAAFYDGAIHLSVTETGDEGDMEAKSRRSAVNRDLRHEYVHHLLVSNGIGKPIWFQEGAAQTFANDQGRGYWGTWRENPIALERMVGTFPNTAAPDVSTAFYAQAYVMVEFLERLCLARPGCGLAELVAALKSGRATPETLFSWAISERGSDLFRTTRLSLWDDYVEHGNFAPETMKALLLRAAR